MKANEAPEKLYMNWVNYPLEEMQVEYTRTDAFIDKACEWINLHIGELSDIYTRSAIRNEFLEDFRKAMEDNYETSGHK